MLKKLSSIKEKFKDFVLWNKVKILLHKHKKRPYFHEREVWYCSVGANIGREQDGGGKRFLRPIIILKKFNNEIFYGVPLTKNKKGEFYFNFSFKNKESSAIISQMRLIDAKRLQHKMGYISDKDYKELKQKIKQMFA